MRTRAALLAAALLTHVIAGNAAAKSPKKVPPPTTTEVKPVMAQFLMNLQALQPYMTSEEAFSDEKNTEEISKRLSSLSRGVTSLNHFDALKTPGFSVSAGVLQDQVRQTNAAFRRGRTEYARWLLNETVQTCISCHSQLPSGATAFVVPAEKVTGAPLNRGDFLFATRQFDEALKVYDQIIANFRPTSQAGGLMPTEPAESALKRKLAIFLRVQRNPERNPEAAAKSLENDLKNLALPGALRITMTQWILELRKPELLPHFQPKTATRAELEGYSKQLLAEDLKGVNLFTSPSKTARYLVLSGVLYEALSTSRADLPQSELLLWLAKCDRSLNKDFFFSMSDLYLQECIHHAPHTLIAKQCYREFEENVVLQYTGSRGTELPDDMQELLAGLRKLVR